MVNFFFPLISNLNIASNNVKNRNNDLISQENCPNCDQVFEIKNSNRGKGLFKTCPSCRRQALKGSHARKSEVMKSYADLDDHLQKQSFLIKGNEYLINSDHELSRLRSFIFNNSVEKGTEFENYVAKILRLNGYQNVMVMKVGPDGGIDITASLNSEKYGVQCKFYEKSNVGNQQVLQFYGALANGKFDKGIFVTTSDFTRSALELEFVNNQYILLLNFSRFHRYFIANLKSDLSQSINYQVICENFRCKELVNHNLSEENCKCSDCGRIQRYHRSFSYYFR